MWEKDKEVPPTQEPPSYAQAEAYPQAQSYPQTQPYPQAQQAQSYPQSQPQVLVYNIPASSVPQYPATQPVTQNEGWWNRHYRNKPQSNSSGTASLIFMSGGMHMIWYLGLNTNQTDFLLPKHLLLSWFIGGIIGVIIGALVCNHIPKKVVICCSSILVIIGGVLQVFDPNSYETILASRYLNGIAVGLVFPLTFVLIGEEMVKTQRGKNAASIDTTCFSCGIFVQIVYSVSWSISVEDTFKSLQLCGVLNIIYGIITFIMASLLVIESPVLFLERGQEEQAIDALRRLQKPYTVTYETYQQLDEHKCYLAESREKTFMQNAIYGVPALLKLCFYRSFAALSFSYFVNFTFAYCSKVTSDLATFPFILYAAARWMGPLLVAFSIDSKGRKNPMIVGFLVSSILALTVGGILHNSYNRVDYDYLNSVKYILIFFQLFSSMSMSSCSVYLTEAFPLPVKPYFMAIVFIVEMLIHIIIICCRDSYGSNIYDASTYFIAVGLLSFVFLGMAIYVMPETKLCTLRECLPKLRRFKNYNN